MQVPDVPHAAVVAEAITSDFYDDRLDLSARDVALGSTWLRMPEVECVRRLRILGASHRAVRLFLTFIAAMDRARDATRLSNNGVELFQSCPELFRTRRAARDAAARAAHPRPNDRPRPPASSGVPVRDCAQADSGGRTRGLRGRPARIPASTLTSANNPPAFCPLS